MNQLHVVEADSWCIRNISYATCCVLLFWCNKLLCCFRIFFHSWIHFTGAESSTISWLVCNIYFEFIQFKEELFLKCIICFDRNDRGRSRAVFASLDKYYFAHFKRIVYHSCQYLLKIELDGSKRIRKF